MNTELTKLLPVVLPLQGAPVTTPSQYTLLDLVQTVSAFATSDDEIVAVVAYLINSGQVLLCGNFAGARIELSASASAAPSGQSLEPGAV